MILRKINMLLKMLGLCLFLSVGFSCSQDENAADEDFSALVPSSEHKLSFSASKTVYAKAETARKTGKGDEASDPFQIDKVEKEGDILKITVSFSGGCAEHTFKVMWGGEVLLTDPCQIGLILTHNAQNDICEANVTEILEIDLNELLGDGEYGDICNINVYSIFNRSDSVPDGAINND